MNGGCLNADVRYKATKVRMWSDHDYDYTETSYYSVERSGEMTFVSVPVDGSEKMADDLMESIEPFKFQSLWIFRPHIFPDIWQISMMSVKREHQQGT